MKNTLINIGSMREISSEDLPLILDWRNSYEVRRQMYSSNVITMDEHLVWWSKISSMPDKKYYMYEFGGIPVGVIAYSDIDLSSQLASWAFYSSPKSNMGIGVFMEYLALDFAFNNLNIKKLLCEVLSTNAGVVKLHKKYGFKMYKEDKNIRLNDGRVVDISYLALSAEDWAKNKLPLYLTIEKISRRCDGR